MRIAEIGQHAMPDPEPNEFTYREKFLVNYYRDLDLSGPRRFIRSDLLFGVGSIVCVIYAAVREDIALGFVAYALVLGRLWYVAVAGGKWARDFQSIFRKYDARLKAAEPQKRDNRDEVV